MPTESVFSPLLVFVYGTLKKGFWNHRVLGDSELVGTTDTVEDSYVLLDAGFPALTQVDEGGAPVRGEVYRVTSPEVLQHLDYLEGEGSMYHRRPITLKGHEEDEVLTYYGDTKVFEGHVPFSATEDNVFEYSHSN